MKTFCIATILLLTSANIFAEGTKYNDTKDFNSLSDTVLIQTKDSKTTLQDLVLAMGLKPSDFKTQYTLPTKEDREYLKMRSYPIVVWENPQEIENPNPPANRTGK